MFTPNQTVRLKGTDWIYQVDGDRIRQCPEEIGHVYHYRLINLQAGCIAFWMEDQLESVN
jgi:hypothetical protein